MLVILVDFCSLVEFYFHLVLIWTILLMTGTIFKCFVDMFMVVFAITSARLSFVRIISVVCKFHKNFTLRFYFAFTSQFVLNELFDAGKDVHVEPFAMVCGLSSAIFTSRHVELELSIVVEFVVCIEGADEDYCIRLFHLVRVFEFNNYNNVRFSLFNSTGKS